MSDMPSPLEATLKAYMEVMSFDDALKAACDRLAGLPGVEDEADRLAAERARQLVDRTKLLEVDTARRKDLQELGWYLGVRDDGVWGGLRGRMLAGGLAGAVEQIDRSTEAIVWSMAEPRVDDDRRLGLVIGNVQSGKTANYSAVIAKALDSGYKFVLVLSGIHNNLRRQTQQRLERDLGVLDDAAHWYRLTDADGDFGESEERNVSAIFSRHERVLAVVKKNSRRLRNVLAFLRRLDAQTKKATPFLIIDDESDQATPDSSSSTEDEPTAINRLMRQIWGEVRNGTYIGYTATPFANVFMDPNSSDESGLDELYPGDFIHVMPTPGQYFGAERIFGLGGESGSDAESSGPDVVRSIPKAEMLVVSPRGRDAATAGSEIVSSLAEAIRWFVVACAVRRVRGQHEEHSTMLIHTTHRVDPHFVMRDAVAEYLEPLRQRARDGDVDAFRGVFDAEIDRAAELYSGTEDAPTWPRVSREIPHVLRSLRLSVDNGQAEESERLSYADRPRTVIVIGGGTLSRGLTLEGLFASYFTRTSNTYDTLLQMGRWFGYRPGYEDLQRVWVSPGLEDDYRFLASVEADVRQEIQQMMASGQKPNDIGVRVRQHPGRLQITNPAKMRHTRTAEADFEGYRLQTTSFDLSDLSVLESNVRVTEALLSKIAQHRSADEPRLHSDVPVDELVDFFEDFVVHERFQETFAGALAWSKEKLPRKLWNVVVQSGGQSEDEMVLAGLSVPSVRRAPLRADPADLAEQRTLNIRALMSGDDILSDLRLEGRAPDTGPGQAPRRSNRDQLDLRRSRTGADGRGLLLLYPISRSSRATSDERMPMSEALAAMDPSLVGPGLGPIMGVALIAPFDTDHVIATKGTFVAVNPVFDVAEETETETVVDTERDFRGGLS